MIRKFVVFLLTLFIAILFAGIYGILHDEITYSIAPEYFTKFKFIQFHVEASAVPYRLLVAYVGFCATWWAGLIIGIVLGLTGLLFPDYKMMLKYVLKAFGLNFSVAICIGFIGFLIGTFYVTSHPPVWYYYPENLIDKPHYIIVGTIHNASYLGGFLGLIFAVIYMRKKR